MERWADSRFTGPFTAFDPIALRPHDPQTGEEIERDQVVKGYEYERGQFLTFTADELKALDIESSKTIDLTTFVPRAANSDLRCSNPRNSELHSGHQ